MHIGTNDVLKFFLNERDGDVPLPNGKMIGYPEENALGVLEHVAVIKEGIRASFAEHSGAIRGIVHQANGPCRTDPCRMPVMSDLEVKKFEEHEREIRRLLHEAGGLWCNH